MFRGQTWALDIVQLNKFGARAGGIYPDDPERYFIFGTPVYSPCDEKVNSTESGNTTEPHLHIHAQTGPGNGGLLDADPVPVRFRNTGWLKRNDVVKVQD